MTELEKAQKRIAELEYIEKQHNPCISGKCGVCYLCLQQQITQLQAEVKYLKEFNTQSTNNWVEIDGERNQKMVELESELSAKEAQIEELKRQVNHEKYWCSLCGTFNDNHRSGSCPLFQAEQQIEQLTRRLAEGE